LETVYEYNDAGWVTKIELRETATPVNVLQRFEYGYDKVGNRLWTKYLNGRGDVYLYDATYQVTGVKYDVDDPTDGYALATGASRTVTYAYDAVGNRTSVVDSASTTTTYTVNNLNQYTSVGVVVPVYSDEGYLIEYGDWEYSYDHVGNLVNAADGTVSITYIYDARGRRVSRSDGVNTVYYVYNGLNLIEERDSMDNVLAEYIYDGALLPRRAIIGGNEYYFQQDVLGNVTALTDENGEIVETYEYDIYGKPSIYDENGNPVAAPMTPFLFTGHYWDADIGLYLTTYRAYSPELGRWLTRDPIRFNGGDVNLYGYVANQPVKFRDYYGLHGGPGLEGGPPPVPVPNGEERSWKWNPDQNNRRGGSWGPSTPIPNQGQPSASWDPEGHWDVDDGKGNRQRYDPDGNPITPEEAHKKPCDDNLPETPEEDGLSVGETAMVAVAAAGVGYVVYRAIRIIPSLIPPLWWTLPANIAVP
jgi:RHS repeat-associated protein